MARHTKDPNEPMKTAATVFLLRGLGEEEIAHFHFTDLAEVAARAITKRHGYVTEVRFADRTFATKRYSWATREAKQVVEEHVPCN